MNTGSRLRTFTFDKETEKKAGTLTMSILSMCLAVTPMIYLAIVGIGLSLGGSLLSGMESISIANGAIDDQLNIVQTCVWVIMCAAIILVIIYGVPALRHLLCAYAMLEDGRLIKMKWRLRRIRSMYAGAIGRRVAKETKLNRSSAIEAVNGIYAFFEGIDMIHNPSVIISHLNGSEVNEYIISIPLDNITVLKKTNKKLVIMADTLVKDKPKRKKFEIYWMYCDMDVLCQLCERGGSIVNQ